MFTGAVATGLFGAIVTLLLGLFDRWQKGRAANPVVVEAEKAGASQAALEVRNQTDEQERKTASAVAGVELAIGTDDGLRKYEAGDSEYNRDIPGPDSVG